MFVYGQCWRRWRRHVSYLGDHLMRAHLIKDGIVANTIAIESIELAQQLFPDHTVIEADQGGPGWRYEDGQLLEPLHPPRDIQAEITALEAKVTERRKREAMISGDYSYIADIDAQIAALRAQL